MMSDRKFNTAGPWAPLHNFGTWWALACGDCLYYVYLAGTDYFYVVPESNTRKD